MAPFLLDRWTGTVMEAGRVRYTPSQWVRSGPAVPGETRRYRGRYVNASELGSFAFCERAWWLEQQRTPSARAPERARGVTYHGQYSERVRSAGAVARLANVAFGLGLMLLLLGLALAW